MHVIHNAPGHCLRSPPIEGTTIHTLLIRKYVKNQYYPLAEYYPLVE